MKRVEYGKQPENFEEKVVRAVKEVEVSGRKYKTSSLDRVRRALNAELGDKREALISQRKVREGIEMSEPTWFKYLFELRGIEFEVVAIQRGTLIRRIKV